MSDKWCRHRTPFDRGKHPVCAAGIDYWAFQDKSLRDWMDAMPCCGRNAAARERCPEYQPKTRAELDAIEADAKLMLQAYSLCMEDVGDKPRPHLGKIVCPKCGGQLLYIAKATRRGTIWGKCNTEACLEWMV